MRNSERLHHSNVEIQISPPNNALPTITLVDDFPRELNRHARYISSWASNQVVIDTGNFSEPGKFFRTFDIDRIKLDCTKELGGIYQGPTPLTHFPNLVGALKRNLNLCCERYHTGQLSQNLGAIWRSSHNILNWLVNSGIYWLRDIEKSDAAQLLDDVAQHSWFKINKVEEKLRGILQQIDTYPTLATKFVGTGLSKTFCLNLEELNKALVIPINPQFIPDWFRNEIALRAGDKRSTGQIVTKGRHPSSTETLQTATTLNLMANPRGEIDGLHFKPFASASASTSSRIDNRHEQTPNIEPRDTILIIRECFAWLFDYGPKIATVLEEVRELIETGHYDREHGDTKIRQIRSDRIQALVAEGVIPSGGPGLEEADYMSYVFFSMVSCGQLIGINHARRAKEIYGGNRLPYGAYYGCVRVIDDEAIAYSSEFWVEKGIRTWRNFPANGLVADAVSLLERFYRIFSAIGEEFPPSIDEKNKLRKMQLFTRRHLTSTGLQANTRITVPYSEYSKHLFSRAGVHPTKFDGKSSPFRRMYVQVFLRRYDMPELPAAARQLGHQGFAQLLHYGTDKHSRTPGESVIEIHPRNLDVDATGLLKNIKNEGTRYLAELIEDLFRGKSVGGLFPRTVIKLAQRLSSRASFSALSLERQSHRLAEKLEKDGYAITPLPHVACAAGDAKQTVSSANCARHGKLRRQDATPHVCHGCIHSWTTANYQKNILDEAANMRTEAASDTTPPALALELLREAEEYEELYRKDCLISEETQKLIESYSQYFNKDLGETE
ncbi:MULTISPECIES: hypothetical protein [unclassified Herbaspirillum]|uniref:hypothetical protein n=1 Tax=unclassified Herbaspirillum TaxID=2624150 RepID=UPI001152E5E4|nr:MULTISPECIES: hypothetical protein [unclassified Herbaspirillum]MBB5392782.1 hypothetical protein [Herbaspirillum sp. SJZ102]TQK04570.1 hypothetical protein FB599_3134 [Herbaspirillum sp. SJZ130]TQK09644.1 hypothetical protein FB598_2627 [Herbaspirillum sp. SJZ106]